MKKIVAATKTVALPLLVGILAGFLIKDDVGLYRVFLLPPFSLPPNLFSILWLFLYFLIGLSFWFFKTTDNLSKKERDEGTLLYRIQLLLNFIWPICFFRWRELLAAFFLLIGLFVFVLATAANFFAKNKQSGILLAPYALFLLYAGYLNFAIWFLNM